MFTPPNKISESISLSLSLSLSHSYLVSLYHSSFFQGRSSGLSYIIFIVTTMISSEKQSCRVYHQIKKTRQQHHINRTPRLACLMKINILLIIIIIIIIKYCLF